MTRTTRLIGGLFRSWFELTAGEQKAVLLVLGIFLLGLAARTWQAQRSTPPPAPASASRP